MMREVRLLLERQSEMHYRELEKVRVCMERRERALAQDYDVQGQTGVENWRVEREVDALATPEVIWWFTCDDGTGGVRYLRREDSEETVLRGRVYTANNQRGTPTRFLVSLDLGRRARAGEANAVHRHRQCSPAGLPAEQKADGQQEGDHAHAALAAAVG